jgi:pilus assembly protein TadC
VRRSLVIALALLSTLAVGLVPPSASAVSPHPEAGPISFTSVSPEPNSTVRTTLPTIAVTFVDVVSSIPFTGVDIIVDGRDVSGFEGVTITHGSVAYAVQSLFPLTVGTNSVTVTLTDLQGNTLSYSWNFTVNTTAVPTPTEPLIRFQTLLLYMGIAASIAAGAFGAWILYLKQTTRFAFRKYFITHPVQRSYLVLYLPAAAAFVFLLVALDWATSTPRLPPLTVYYVFVVAIILGILPFALESRRLLSTTRAYERAFAQFLFEMADAMRGGLDPAKAIVELAKTSSNILRRHLRIAADSLRLGRSFERVLRDMVKPIPSPLIHRYADLIADASGVGGETSVVIYRAAKDMDDFVKIEEERAQQLTLPVAVVYIAFAVLMAVLFALMYLSPTLGSLNISFIGGGGNPLASAGTTTASAVPKLTTADLDSRFLQLMLINSIGTGAIIGAFTEGRARYGLLHSLALVGATMVAFTIFIW